MVQSRGSLSGRQRFGMLHHWVRHIVGAFEVGLDTPIFVKQFGRYAVGSSLVVEGDAPALSLLNRKGSHPFEWEPELRI